MKVYFVYDDNITFDLYVRKPICSRKDCLVIELTFKDIRDAIKNNEHVLRKYVNENVLLFFWDLYKFAKFATPCHITANDRIFIVIENIGGEYWMLDDVHVYILFHHFEHCSPTYLMKLLSHLMLICENTDCLEVDLEEFSCDMEYILLSLTYSTMDRLANKILYRPNPWRKLISAFLQDYYIYKGYVQKVFEVGDINE